LSSPSGSPSNGDGMSDKALVSCIITFLNAEEFVEEAIESVLAQTHDDLELLLVDDGSTDDSPRIALRYEEDFPGKVRYLEHKNHENRGAAASRNLGIEQARGEYIALLDSDDVWLEHKLEEQVDILDSHPEAGMVYGQSQYWHSWTKRPEDAHRDHVPKLGVQTDTLFEPATLSTLVYPLGPATAPCPSDLLLRREAVEKTGGFEEAFRGMYQLYDDQTFLAKMYLNEPVYVAGKCWDRYRQHPHQIVSVVRDAGEQITVRLAFLRWLAEYFYVQGAGDPELWKLLQEKLLQTTTRIQTRQSRDETKQLRSRDKRIEDLQSSLKDQRRRTRRLRKQNRKLMQKMQNLDEELAAIRGSALWQLTRGLGRIRARLSR
jgi:glycosyltransferase involved in cell wall biosynthesis